MVEPCAFLGGFLSSTSQRLAFFSVVFICAGFALSRMTAFFFYVCLFSHTFLSFLFQPHSFYFLFYSTASKKKELAFFFVTTLWQLYKCVCAFLNLFSCFCSVEDHLFFSVVVVFFPPSFCLYLLASLHAISFTVSFFQIALLLLFLL